MTRIAVGSVTALAVAVLAVVTLSSAGANRKTTIYMTRNFNMGSGRGQFPAECKGVVATDPIPTNTGDRVTWTIKNGHDGTKGAADKCENLMCDKVELMFANGNTVGAASRKPSTGQCTIEADISMNAAKFPMTNKYQVFYKTFAAGPDPDIVVDCPSCGPGGRGDSADNVRKGPQKPGQKK